MTIWSLFAQSQFPNVDAIRFEQAGQNGFVGQSDSIRDWKIMAENYACVCNRYSKAGQPIVESTDWREYRASDAMGLLGLSRNTLTVHAASQEYPYIEKVKRGRYRIDHSHAYIQGIKK